MILGPFDFNIFLCDLFLTIKSTDFINYADDNTPYTTGENIYDVIGTLEETAKVMFRLFTKNQMKPNADNCHLILNYSEQKEVRIDGGTSDSRNPAGIYLFKVDNRNTRTRCEICSKLTIKTPERRQWRRSGVFIVNFEHISHLVLVFLLLTLNM